MQGITGSDLRYKTYPLKTVERRIYVRPRGPFGRIFQSTNEPEIDVDADESCVCMCPLSVISGVLQTAWSATVERCRFHVCAVSDQDLPVWGV